MQRWQTLTNDELVIIVRSKFDLRTHGDLVIEYRLTTTPQNEGRIKAIE